VSAVQQGAAPERRRGSRAVFVIAALAVVILLGFVGAAFLPRWWSHFIGDQVGGSIATGVALGLVYGFVFTGLPLVLLRWAFRRRRSWRVWLGAVLVAVLLAAPNLLTLGIVAGSGNAAHAGERTLDVQAPGFRTSSLVGAIGLAGAFVFAEYLLYSRRRSRRRAKRLDEELRTRRDVPGPVD